jgi:hypothetical protein
MACFPADLQLMLDSASLKLATFACRAEARWRVRLARRSIGVDLTDARKHRFSVNNSLFGKPAEPS